MIIVADHQGGPPGPEPAKARLLSRPATGLSGPVPGSAFAAFVGPPGESLADAPETEAGEDTPLFGAAPDGPGPAMALEGRAEKAGQGATDKAGAHQAPQAGSVPPDDGVTPGPGADFTGVDDAAHAFIASPMPRSSTVPGPIPEEGIARGDPARARSGGDGRAPVAGTSAAAPADTPVAPPPRPALRAAGPRAASPEPAPPPTLAAEPRPTPLPAIGSAAQAGATPLPTAIASTAAAPKPGMAALRAAEPPSAVSGPRASPTASAPPAAPAIPAVAFAATPQAVPLQAGLSTALAAALGAVSDPSGHADPDLGAAGHRASASLATALAPPVQPATAGQDIPRQIAVQIAQAADGGPGGPRGTVELSLSPEELGRVRLRLHPSEAGLSVTITADRPETLELMRRNIDLLAREFLEIGYQDTQFDFAGGGQDPDDDTAVDLAGSAPALDTVHPETIQPVVAARLVLGDRLDIRL